MLVNWTINIEGQELAVADGPMDLLMKEIGSPTSAMDSASIYTKEVQNMKAAGSTTSNMVPAY